MRIITGFSAVSRREIMIVPSSTFLSNSSFLSRSQQIVFEEWKRVKSETGGTGEFSHHMDQTHEGLWACEYWLLTTHYQYSEPKTIFPAALQTSLLRISIPFTCTINTRSLSEERRSTPHPYSTAKSSSDSSLYLTSNLSLSVSV